MSIESNAAKVFEKFFERPLPPVADSIRLSQVDHSEDRGTGNSSRLFSVLAAISDRQSTTWGAPPFMFYTFEIGPSHLSPVSRAGSSSPGNWRALSLPLSLSSNEEIHDHCRNSIAASLVQHIN